MTKRKPRVIKSEADFELFLKESRAGGAQIPDHRFENIFGERFVIIDDGLVGPYITGDEFDWHVTHLFDDFIYDSNELRKIGKVLIDIADARDARVRESGGTQESDEATE